jgi:diacylglycerol kinase
MSKLQYRFSLRARILSFRYALSGLFEIIKQEPNFRIHLIAFAVVIVAGIRLRLSHDEWILLMIVSFAVLI